MSTNDHDPNADDAPNDVTTSVADEDDDSELKQLYLRLPPDIKQSMSTLARAEGVTMRDLVIIEHLAFLEGPYDEVRGKLRAWVQQARESGVLPEPKTRR